MVSGVPLVSPLLPNKGTYPSQPTRQPVAADVGPAVFFGADRTEAQQQALERLHTNNYLRYFPEYGPPKFNPKFHAERRDALLAKLPPNTTVIVTGAKETPRNYDVNYPFRQDSNFYYLTGFDEPDAVAVLSNVPGKPEFTLFVRPRDPVMETWNGIRAGAEGAVKTYKADQAFTIDRLDKELPGLLKGSTHVGAAYAEYNCPLNDRIRYNIVKNVPRRAFREVAKDIHELRTIKTPYEIALLKRACEISAYGHMRGINTMKLTRKMMAADPERKRGRNEGEIQAAIEQPFRAHGAVRVGYPTIGGSGHRSCILHYDTNKEYAEPGDLVLVDAGAEYGYYTADITRTWPVSGKYTPEQKAIYDIVLDAQESSIRMVKPGVTIAEIHANAVRKVTEGLVKLGLLKGDVDQLIQDRAYFKYFMHGTSHMLGMDVHDVNLTNQKSKKDGSLRGHSDLPLEPGMVFTVEPGIYIPKDDTSVDPKWRGIGVRIEDDILVTPNGYENMSAHIPRKTEEIEALMAG